MADDRNRFETETQSHLRGIQLSVGALKQARQTFLGSTLSSEDNLIDYARGLVGKAEELLSYLEGQKAEGMTDLLRAPDGEEKPV